MDKDADWLETNSLDGWMHRLDCICLTTTHVIQDILAILGWMHMCRHKSMHAWTDGNYWTTFCTSFKSTLVSLIHVVNRFYSMLGDHPVLKIQLFLNMTLKIQGQARSSMRSKFKVTKVCPTSYWFTSLSFCVNLPSYSCDTDFSTFDLENPRSRSSAHDVAQLQV